MTINCELIFGFIIGFALAIIIFIVCQLVDWRNTHTNVIVVDDDTYQCLNCGSEITGLKPRYCPKCGRIVDKVIDKE